MKTQEELTIYSTPPIDFWEGWREWETFLVDVLRDAIEFSRELQSSGFEGILVRWDTAGSLAHHAQELVNLRILAQEGFERAGWEGDGIFRATHIPADLGARAPIAITVKQSNNGTTFFASQIELPWFDEFKVD